MSTEAQSSEGYKLPTTTTLQHAAKLAIVEDKPIMLDYWTSSLEQKALIGLNEKGEKLLAKSEEECASAIAKIYKVADELIIMTESSLYVVDNKIQLRRASA